MQVDLFVYLNKAVDSGIHILFIFNSFFILYGKSKSKQRNFMALTQT